MTMKNIKKERSKKRDKSSKIEEEAEYDTIDAVCSYAIDGPGQPLRGLKWQGGGKPYSEASVPTQELNEDGLEYSARNKMESKARRKEARAQMKKMQNHLVESFVIAVSP